MPDYLTYLTPGLYQEIVNDIPTENDLGRVDIAAFIGVAERGPLHTPTRVNSTAHFQAAFGSFLPHSQLAYVVKAFFENGGSCCYIVRVATDEAAAARTTLLDQAGQVALAVTASSAGTWGNDLSVSLGYAQTVSTWIVADQEAQAEANLGRSFVESVTGFAVGSLVSIFRTGDVQPLYRIVTGLSHTENTLSWHTPLDPSYRPISSDQAAQRIWIELVEFSLTLYQADRAITTYTHLSFVPFSNNYIEHVINESRPEPMIQVEVGEGIRQLFASGTIAQQLSRLRDASQLVQYLPSTTHTGILDLLGGRDGLKNLQSADLIGDSATRRGLHALEDIAEVAIVAIPDLLLRTTDDSALNQPSTFFALDDIFHMQQALIDYCEQGQHCIALLDPPVHDLGATFNVREISGWRQRFQSSYAALYYPQAIVQDPIRLSGQIVRSIPPCGHVAGMFARMDHEVGVHRAPANEALSGIQDLSVQVTAAEHGDLNELGVNCIRVFAGRGVRIYGARTLAPDPAWRYVNVRRLFIMLKRSIEALMQWAVFEPNSDSLSQTLIVAITTLLEGLWQQGAFVGARATDAFFVKCDAQNNPPDLQDSCVLLVEVGVAPSVPAEFVVLRIHRSLDTNDVVI